MSEIKYVNIDDDRFWDILSDEAYVEGQQSVRIRDALKNISTSEKEIIRKTMERIVERLEEFTEQTYYKSVEGDAMAGERNKAYHNAIKVVKEEGGVNARSSKRNDI